MCGLSRKVGNKLHITRKGGGLNCAATKTLNVPSVDRPHCCNVENPHRYSRRLVDSIVLNLVTRKSVQLAPSCSVCRKLPFSLLALQLFSLTTYRVFLRRCANIPLQYLSLNILLPHSLQFTIH